MNFTKTYDAVMIKDFGDGGNVKKYGKLVLTNRDGRLSGSIFPVSFWLDSYFRGGSIDDNNFEFTVYTSTPCQQYSMTVDGHISGDTVSGVAHTPLGDFELRGTEIKG